MKFTYTATREGETYTGSVEAETRFDVYKHIRAEGGSVVSVTNATHNTWSLAYWNARLSSVKEHDKIIFAGNLAAMIAAGLSITRALSVAVRQTKNPRFKNTLEHIQGDIQKGGTFNEALARFPSIFSDLFVAMVRAGEESGSLSDALTNIARQLERAYNLKKKVKSALIYPSIIVVAIFGIGFLMMVKVVPTLAGTFKELGADLPASTQLVIAVSDFLVAHTFVALSIIFGIISLVYIALQTAIGKRVRDKSLLIVPIIGPLVCEINSARMARTFSSLLAAGVDIVSALSITSDVVQNSYHRDVLAVAGEKVKKGEQLSDVFVKREYLYPPLVGEMIMVGEETGALSEMLLRVADFYESEVEAKTKNLSTIIEPFLMLFIGGAVGFFAVSMVAPIYSLSNVI